MIRKLITTLLIAALTLAGAAAAEPGDSDPYLVGEWQTTDGMAVMTIDVNPGGEAWDVEVVFAQNRGAYVFKTTIRYDEDRHCFTYNKGKYWDVPITDSDEAPELGEAKIAGATGSFTFTGDPEDLWLSWVDDERPEESMEFHKAGL